MGLDTMQELHQKLIEIMDVFHVFCKEHGLTYYMLGGTMLGAYRHQGFIPWDDDIDIGMPRADYERLLAFAEKQVPEGYRIRNHRFERGIPYAFTHFEDVNTTCIEQRRSKDTYAGGVYLEIFPLDEAPKTGWQRLLKSYKTRYYKRILYGLILDYGQKKRSLPKAVIIKLIRAFANIDDTTDKLEKCVRKGSLHSAYYSNLLGHWGIREDVLKEIFGVPVLYAFAGRSYYGVSKPEEYLKCLYGDKYMTPPSEEEKEAGKHPAAYLNLRLPYAEYLKQKENLTKQKDI